MPKITIQYHYCTIHQKTFQYHSFEKLHKYHWSIYNYNLWISIVGVGILLWIVQCLRTKIRGKPLPFTHSLQNQKLSEISWFPHLTRKPYNALEAGCLSGS